MNHWIKIQALFVITVSCFQLLSGCAAHTPHDALKKAPLPELIARKRFFNPAGNTINYLVSPDGKQLAWLAEYQNNLTIFFKPIGTTNIRRINTASWCHVNWYTWAQNSRHLIYTLDVGPNRARHIYQSDSYFPDKKPVNLTPGAKRLAFFKSGSPYDSDNILISQDKIWYDSYDLFRVNVNTGADQLIGTNSASVVEWITDHKGVMTGRIRADDQKNWHLELYHEEPANWTQLATWKPDEYIRSYGMTPDGKGVWLLSNKDRDRISLVRFDLKTKKEILVCEDPQVDIEDVFISRTTGKALFAYSYPDYPKTWVLDPRLKADLAVFKGKTPFGIQILGMDNTETLWTVMVFDEKQKSFYLYNRTTGQKQFLGSRHWLADSSALADTRPVTIQSRDNMILKCFLTLPVGTGAKPLPMVLLVHGGPWVRDYWEPDQLVQFFANRGYGVLQVNFRGSEGFGRAHQAAAKKEFAGKMHNDLIDAVNWSIEQKIADPKSIAIVGASYGGFAAMAGLTFTPDVFACAISINGVSDWVESMASFPQDLPLYRRRGFEIWYDYVGNPKNLRERKDMALRSPLFFAERVKKPILIIYGERDRIVSPSQSVKMIDALKKNGKEVTYKRFENEGHGFSWIHNSEQMYQDMEKFLARHLGGRLEK